MTAAPPPSGEIWAKKSFADVVSGAASIPSYVVKTPSLHKGEPALIYSEDEIDRLAAPFMHALVGRFDMGRPSMVALRKAFPTIGLKGSVTLGLIDQKHILITTSLVEDYVRLWLKGQWYLQGFKMRVFKWTPQFRPSQEPSIIPMWVSLPDLPLHFYNKSVMYSIATILGKPLKLDAATASLTRPSVARMCVEVDLKVPLPHRVFMGSAANGFWQPIIYDDTTLYCEACHVQGDLSKDCTKSVATKQDQQIVPLEKPPQMKQVWAPRKKTHVEDQPVESPPRDRSPSPSPTPQIDDQILQQPPKLPAIPSKDDNVVGRRRRRRLRAVYTSDSEVDHIVPICPDLTVPLLKLAATEFNVKMAGEVVVDSKGNCTIQQRVPYMVPERYPEVEASRVQHYACKLGFSDSFSNNESRVWLFWKKAVFDVVVERTSPFFVHGVLVVPNGLSFQFVVLHAPSTRGERVGLWEELSELRHSKSGPWFFGRDFNAISSADEYMGPSVPNRRSMQDFVDFMNSAALSDHNYNGDKFTWSNGTTWTRLDRILVSVEWYDVWSSTVLEYLPRLCSDHAPMLGTLTISSESTPGRFVFQEMWLRHDSFMQQVSEVWNFPSFGDPVFSFSYKMRAVKQRLRYWNKYVFGNVSQALLNAADKVQYWESSHQLHKSEHTRTELFRARAEYHFCSHCEEIFWRQRSRVKWLGDGDMNTRFFHAKCKVKRAQLTVSRLKVNDQWIEEQNALGEAAVVFFRKLLAAEDQGDMNMDNFLQYIPQLVTPEMDSMLVAIPDKQEVFAAVKELNAQSAPGPDGFSGVFYQTCWSVIGDDFTAAIQHLFQGSPMPKSFAATSLVLLPKVSSPVTFSDFRPISLCNFTGKLFSKILSRRLATLLPQLVLWNQTGFVGGRSIHENILLAQEILQSFDVKAKHPNLLLKLDLVKAFDRVSWPFLYAVMEKFGFSQRWSNLIANAMGRNWFSVVLNGASYGFFRSSRGVKQGDPLSPMLFVLSLEPLSRALQALHTQGLYPTYHFPPRCSPITHLAYADDLLLFASADPRRLRFLMEFLSGYERVSGQLISRQKSVFVLPSKVPRRVATRIETVTGFARRSFPLKYLGVPLFKGRITAALFDPLVEKIVAKLNGWSAKLLSQAGRLILIKHVLSSIPLYLLMALAPPQSVCRRLESLMASFFWGVSDFGPRMHWRAWHSLCLPTEENGLGVRRIQDVIQAYTVKLWWLFRTSSSLWATYMRQKYTSMLVHPAIYVDLPRVSMQWKRIRRGMLLAEDQIGVRVREGEVNIWFEYWASCCPLECPLEEALSLSFRQLQEEPQWLGRPVQALVFEAMSSSAVQLRHGPDIFFWRLVASGHFSLSSAWNLVRRRGSPTDLAKYVWHAAVPRKFSIFLWRSLNSILPVDSVIQHRGVVMCSKCVFCSGEETIRHLFLECPWALALWEHFTAVLGMGGSIGGSLGVYLKSWWVHVRNTLSGRIYLLLPILVCWIIWSARCAYKFNDTPMSSSHAKESVHILLHEISLARPFPPALSQNDKEMVEIFRLAVQLPSPPRWQLVSWRKEGYLGCILNVDGASKSGGMVAGGGGVIRTHSGDFIAAFSSYYGAVSSVEAEVLALLEGLQLAFSLSLQALQVQCDSLLLVEGLNNRISLPWQLFYKVQQIRDFLNHNSWHIRHVYREANRVADVLANEACAQQLPYRPFLLLSMLSHKARVELSADQKGFSMLRCR